MAFEHVQVLTGPARSGKTTRLLERYRQALHDAEPGEALWLTPTALAARQLRARLLDGQLRACFEPRIWTFDQFVHGVLDASGRKVQRISPLQSVELVRHLLYRLAERGELHYFAPVIDSAGLAPWVARFLQELKHHEIWPEEFLLKACRAAGGPTEKDRDVHAIYKQYQEFLNRRDLYDAAGAYWQARTLLKEKQTALVDRLRLLIVDGFTDFTRTQQEILRELFTRSREAWVSLPLEEDDRRRELFGRSRRTWEEFLQPLGAKRVEQPWQASSWPALDHVQRELFASEAQPWPQAQPPRGIHLLAPPGTTHEVQQVARQIKRLLVDGDPETHQPVSPAQVLVVARRVEPLAELIRQEFAEAGVPVFLETGLPLVRSGLGQVLLQLLQLVENNASFDDVMALLGNSSLRPSGLTWDRTTAMTVRQAVRRCQVPEGWERLLQAYARLVERQAEENQRTGNEEQDEEQTDGVERKRDWPLEHLQQGRELLQRLAGVLAPWQNPGTLAQWLQRVEETLNALGAHPDQATSNSPDVQRNRRVWHALRQELLALHRLFDGEEGECYLPEEFLATLRDLLQQTTYQEPAVPDACVRVVSAIHARGVSYPWVFLIGLTEDSFPAPRDRLAVYSPAQRRQLRQQRLPLPGDEDHHQGEMLLFYELLTRATRGLWLSYPALNEKAETLLPSPYLQEVQQLLGLQMPPLEEQSLVQLPRDGRAINARQRWMLAVNQALQHAPEWLGWMVQHDPTERVAQLHRTWQCVRQRGRSEGFGPWEGMLELPVALEAVQRKWAQGATISVTALERYAYCPWRFVMERLLGIRPLEEPAEELESTQLGLMFHALMAQGHRQYPDLEQLAGQSPDEFLRQWTPLVDAVLEEHLGPAERRSGVQEALAQLAREDLLAMLRAYHEQLGQYLAAMKEAQWTEPPRPEYLELAFGTPPRGGQADPGSTSKGLLLESGQDRLRLSGRVDRVDLGRIGKHRVAVVIDYKTSSPRRLKPPQGETPLLDALQLDVYPAALEQLVLPRGVRVVESAYWSARARDDGRGYVRFAQRYQADSNGLKPDDQWQQRWQALQELVLELWRKLRGGEFVVFSADDRCTQFCDLARVCRIGQIRNLEKTWDPAEADQ